MTGGRRAVRHGLILGWTISAIAIASVVAVGIPVAGAASPGIIGNGTNSDPYTVRECHASVSGCEIEFNSMSLKGFETKNTQAYLCPTDFPYLVRHDYSPGRLVPFGVQVNEPGGIGVTIFSVKTTPDTYDVDGKGMPVLYISGTSTTEGTATNWDPLKTTSYSITIHCTYNRNDATRYVPKPGGTGG